MRAQLVILSGQLFSLDENALMSPALAIELIHLYSCVHDDLPCMDDDDYRRGRMTIHKQFDEATALLLGDFFLTLSFDTLAQSPLPAETKVALTQILAKRSGGLGMIAGQFFDLEKTGCSLQEDEMLFMHEKKTASLIQAAAEFGAEIARASPKVKTHLSRFGRALGIGYQITDDLLDKTGSPKTLGKPVGSDEKNGKTTSISLYGVTKTEEKATFWYNLALEELRQCSLETTALEEFATRLLHRRY